MKKPLKPIDAHAERQSGQSLPLALVGMVAVLGLTFFMLNVGRLLVAREETRMRTDVAVMSGATLYARCLNIYALLKKMDDTAKDWSEAVGWFPFGGEFFDVSYEAVHAAKVGFQEGSPYGALAAVEWVAWQNHLLALPYWNVKDFFDPSANVQGLLPSLNYDNDEDSSTSSSGSGGSNQGPDRYSYHHESTGEKVDVANGQVGQDQSGGAQGSYRDSKTGRFVHRDQGQDAQAEGEHSLTLLTYSLQDPQSQVPGFKAVPSLISISRARVSGGDFDISSSKSLKWGCFLAPVTVKDSGLSLPQAKIPLTGIGPVDHVSQEANALLDDVRQWISRIPAILH